MTSRRQIVDGFAAHDLLWAAALAKRFDRARHQRRAPLSAIGRSPGRVPVASVQLLTRRVGVSFSFDMITELLPTKESVQGKGGAVRGPLTIKPGHDSRGLMRKYSSHCISVLRFVQRGNRGAIRGSIKIA
jgi:hypothetical protein